MALLVFLKLKYQRQILKIEDMMKNLTAYMKQKNTVMPHGLHVNDKAYYMEKSTIFAYPQSDHALLHWKCVLRC